MACQLISALQQLGIFYWLHALGTLFMHGMAMNMELRGDWRAWSKIMKPGLILIRRHRTAQHCSLTPTGNSVRLLPDRLWQTVTIFLMTTGCCMGILRHKRVLCVPAMIHVSALALILLAVMLSARDKDRKADLRQFLPLNLHQVLILTCLKLAVC